jgi:hypothetical protein
VVPPASHKLTGVRGTQDATRQPADCAPTGLSPSVVVPSSTFGSAAGRLWVVLQPQPSVNDWFGLFPVRSPLLGESPLISRGPGTEMFQFPDCPPAGLCIRPPVSRHHPGRVAPLGISGLLACMQLPLNVSPVSASVIGLVRLGILRVLSGACAVLPAARAARCASSSSCLGKIEVIMLFNCEGTPVCPLTTGKWKTV